MIKLDPGLWSPVSCPSFITLNLLTVLPASAQPQQKLQPSLFMNLQTVSMTLIITGVFCKSM